MPEDQIGIFHGSEDKYPDIPSVSIEEIAQTQFLLITHKRIKSPKFKENPDAYLYYIGKKRDLVIWDESLIASSGQTLKYDDVSKAVSEWLRVYEDKKLMGKESSNPERLEQFINFIQKARSIIQEHLSNQEESVFSLPLSYMELDEAIQMVNLNTVGGSRERETLRKLCSWTSRSDTSVRIVQAGNDYSAVQFFTLVDKNIDQIIILDASAEIKNLMRLDESIKVVPTKSQKDHSNVSLYLGNVKSSRDAIEKDLLEQYVDEICHLIENVIPANEEILILYFKERGINTRAQLENKLLKRGVANRARFLSWGQHKASNAFSDIKHVITFGVMRRDKCDIAADVIAQTNDIRFNVTHDIVNNVLASEIADMLFQGFSRCNCRHVDNGFAGTMSIYMFLPSRDKKVIDLLQQVMPNVQIDAYSPRYLPEYRASDNTDKEALGDQICEHLAGSETDKVSFSSLKKTICVDEMVSRRTWNYAREYASRNAVGWSVEKASFVRH